MSSLGATLSAAREARGVSHSEAAAATNIKVQHIEAIEQNDFSGFAAPAYAKGFIRIYAEYLGLDSAPLVKQYLDAHDAPASPLPRLLKPEDEPATPQPTSPAKDEANEKVESSSEPKPGLNVRALSRILLPVLGIVVLVIILTKFFGGKGNEDADSPAGGTSSEAGRPLLIGEPPAPYLDPSAAP
jgi:cytoskeletal protein RodZ